MFCSLFFFKQKTAYEMRISDWSSDVCSSDLLFTAAILPGLLLTGLMMAYLYVLIKFKPEMAPRESTRISSAQRWAALKYIWPAGLMILAVLGTIYFGIATPTEIGRAHV